MRELCFMTSFQLQYGVPGCGNDFVLDTDAHSFKFSLLGDVPSAFSPIESLDGVLL